MRSKNGFILAVFLVSCSFLNGSQIKSAQASDSAPSAERAANQPPGPSALVPAHDTKSSKTSAPFEPLLLLLFGSALFFIGTAIKLVLSRKLDPKQIAPAANGRVLNAKNVALRGGHS